MEGAIRKLRLLNESAPEPLSLPTSEEVNALEQKLGVTFQLDFRRYLLEASDVCVGTLEPVTALPENADSFLPNVLEDARIYGVPKNLLPICEDNSDFYCLDEDGKVVFWSHNGAGGEKWSDLATWIVEVWIGES